MKTFAERNKAPSLMTPSPQRDTSMGAFATPGYEGTWRMQNRSMPGAEEKLEGPGG
ncbi:hypothetical protein [Rhizobium sp. 18055]|uniref:hypothetical protein n=1 Tax=Rhizobium sp. 18055 TaxID=2681403 RepID=UPI001358D6BE|nr:hypothetical protein [Rhizobium sp. 18055]